MQAEKIRTSQFGVLDANPSLTSSGYVLTPTFSGVSSLETSFGVFLKLGHVIHMIVGVTTKSTMNSIAS